MDSVVSIEKEDPFSPDAARLIAALSAEIRTLYGGDGSGGFSPEDATGPSSAFVLARADGEAVGCGALRPFEKMHEVGEVKRMFVAPEWRGRGIARLILEALEQIAAQEGYLLLRLETGLLQPEAMCLYRSAGYREIPCLSTHHEHHESVCFEKPVQQSSIN